MSALDTHVSKYAIRRHIEHRTWVYEHEPPWGEVFTCPRCGWQSKGMKHRIGAEWQGEKHALVCKPRTVREDVQATSESRHP